MPQIKCEGCGRITNTACCNAFEEKPWGKTTKCYQAYVNGEWVKGCGFDELPNMLKMIYWRKEWGKCPIKKVKRGT